jgi:hypothetical protein
MTGGVGGGGGGEGVWRRYAEVWSRFVRRHHAKGRKPKQ